MPLERRDLVDRALTPLARRYGFEPDTIREMLADSKGELERLLASSGQPETRRQVNEWWGVHRSQFREFGLGVLLRVSSPAKLPPDTYQQLVCLSWLTSEMTRRRFEARIPVTTPRGKAIPARLWLGRRLARQIWHWVQGRYHCFLGGKHVQGR